MSSSLIIGYTSGIGEAIFNECKKRNYDTSGIGSATKDMIQNWNSRVSIVKKAKEADCIYIIPSSDTNRFAQTEMLCDLYEAYKHTPKKIIVISGSSPETRNRSNPDLRVKKYDVAKYGLDKMCLDLNLLENQCQIINIKPGRFSGKRYDNSSHKDYIDVKKLSATICDIVELSTEMRITSTTIVSCPYTGMNITPKNT